MLKCKGYPNIQNPLWSICPTPHHLRGSFTKLNDVNINYNLRNLETDLALSRLKTNFLKRCFKYSDAMLWNYLLYEANTAQSLSKFKSELASLPCAGSL